MQQRNTYNKNKQNAKKPFMRRRFVRKICRFCKEKVYHIDYKNIDVIRHLVSNRGKILSSKITGTCSKHQRQLTNAILRLRTLAILPYTVSKPKRS